MLVWENPALGEKWNSWKQVLYVGLPAAGTNVLVPVSTGIITGMVATYGAEAVAVLGVGSRVESLGLAVVMALSSVLTPFVGQNFGAGRLDRVKLSVSYVQRFSMIWGAALFAILAALGRYIAPVFNDDAMVVATLVDYLWIVPLSYGLLGVLMLVNATLNALNRPFQSALLTLLRLFVLYVPLAFAGSALFGLKGIFGAAALANALAGTAAYLWLRKVLADEISNRRVQAIGDTGGRVAVAGE